MRLVAPDSQQAISADADLFERDTFATGLLTLFERSDTPLVIVLDEQWGSGKTVFGRRLVNRALSSGFKTVYLDAFKKDYAPDVFVTLSAEILESLGLKGKQKKSISSKAKDVAKVVGRVGLKSLVRAATIGAVSAADLSDAGDEVLTAVGDQAEAELDSIIDKRLSAAAKDDAAFETFSRSLSEVVTANEGKPLIFVIDELDRCRPDHCLGIVEVIRHFFSVPGVHFLLLVEMNYLAACVSARYGSQIDGSRFLEKFITATVSFPILEKNSHDRAIRTYVDSIVGSLPDDQQKGELKNGMARFVSDIAIKRGYSLRRIEKVLTQFGLSMAFSKPNNFRLGPIVFVLCDMKISAPHLFRKAKSGQLTWRELQDFYAFDEQKDGWYIRWLRYFLDTSIDRTEEEWSSLERSLWNWNLSDDPMQTIVYVANRVVDRIEVGV